jgi:phosphatidylethanolamine-binding protein (PEBP) family uncharacterized protein
MKPCAYPLTAGLLLLLCVACSDKEQNGVALDVDFQWNPPCSRLAHNPRIALGDVPEGTVRFLVSLIDKDLPAFDHGSGFVDYKGSAVIEPGTVDGSYKGPSPPYGVIHDYEITVKALDADGEVLGIGRKVRRYPPEGEEEARWAVCN